jgi:hypothetical protein
MQYNYYTEKYRNTEIHGVKKFSYLPFGVGNSTTTDKELNSKRKTIVNKNFYPNFA